VGQTLGSTSTQPPLRQGVDPAAAIKALKGAVFPVHAKDTAIDPYNTAVKAWLDTTSYHDLEARSWIFRSIGWGTDTATWKRIVNGAAPERFDGVVSSSTRRAGLAGRGPAEVHQLTQGVPPRRAVRGGWWV